ncbi:3-deoxy-7-phosphoheptulonate synthase [Salinisphaera sp. USBA-960]|uniref:3-deoxy-7-phosphoheptulonate synthase n=1 Tax=Salinisphaera orenii TaxID=856731 RepID=UPI000DBE0C65|nr:3-deoxy-7-phosphoheptulonate synthase [Salifodinibacter halophilus]NNC26653.1 3-deoxy-7-phosphoheptulonate synthase [Salifodinibacter halophilus]
MQETDDLRINGINELAAPETVIQEIPVSADAAQTVADTREAIRNILSGDDDRLLVVVGPCSIHDVDLARDYADQLASLRERYQRDLLIVMRVYFEKPRTTVGWKGLINDPELDDSFKINKGVRQARQLLAELAERGMPAGVEFLDLITPQYLADLVSWGAIGARTTESQGHRELASGLSCPVGFKNGTGGAIKVAADAVGAAHHPHRFLSVTKSGQSAIISTAGNQDTHIILRGGSNGPNFDTDSVASAVALLQQADLPSQLMVDFSHANSRKQPHKQLEVGDDIAGQITAGSRALFGVMIESLIKSGKQDLVPGVTPDYGVSVTDGCLGFDDTEALLGKLADAVAQRRELAQANHQTGE